jgi:hypothetical protein
MDGPQPQENRKIIVIVRKLDKATLNLYTRGRAKLGERKPGMIGLLFEQVEWLS